MKGYNTILLVGVFALSGCLPKGQGPGIDAILPVGNTYTVQSVQPLITQQPVSPDPIVPAQAFRASPGRVLPPGASVNRVSNLDPRVSATASEKVDLTNHPWVFVDVVASPIASQAGWAGWVHIDALGTTEIVPVSGEPDLLEQTSHLCAWPDASDEPGPTCPLEIHPSLPLQVLECSERDYVQVQLWDPQGNYVSGYLKSSHFKLDPCP